MRSQVPVVAVLMLVLAAVATVALVGMHAAGSRAGELISADDRALLNPLYMMKQLASIKKWTEPKSSERQIPKRAVLEAQVAAKQQAARDKATLVAEAHTEAREGRHAAAEPAKFTDKKVTNYEMQAKALAAKSQEDSETASELSAKAQELAAEAKKQEQLSRNANARGEKLIQKADDKSRRLKEQANHESHEATHLVVYAKKLAQRMVKEEALDEMKKWMAANAAKNQKRADRRSAHHPAAHHTERRVSHVRGAHKSVAAAQLRFGGRGRLPLTALRAKPAAKPAPKPATEGDKIRSEFERWRSSQLKEYAHEHELYTKTQFCNSQATAHSPSIAELQRSFGADWEDVPPRVASLAAVNGCMQALGLRAKDETPANFWTSGPLKGKADSVRACAHGDNKACAQIADSPGAYVICNL